MITKWTISNFKSVVKETPLDIAPLTILAGPNSSGKSTILQSLLLVSQTLANKVSSRSVVLNGTQTKLGQFDDLKSHTGESEQITIAWECNPTESGQMMIIEGPRLPGPAMVFGRRIDSIKKISCKLAFDTNPGSPKRDQFQLQPQLFLFTMSVLTRTEDNTDRNYEFTVSRSKAGNAKVGLLQIDDLDSELGRSSLEYDITFDAASLDEIREEFISAEPIGCVLRHFIPERISIRVNMIEEISKQLFEILSDDRPRSYRSAPPLMERELVIPNGVLEYLRGNLNPSLADLLENEPTLISLAPGLPVKDWINRVRQLSPEKRRELRLAIVDCRELQDAIKNALRAEWKLGESEYKFLFYRPPVELRSAFGYLDVLFSNSVKYLGPLRDEPKPLYPLATHADPADIGLRGEMTAAVLNLHKDRRIRYIPSIAFEKAPLAQTPVVRTLESAVTDWLKYLGVAQTAKSADMGKLGHELKVTLSEGGRDHDLTHVGVGVSQVLPILVMSLLADRDTTLIFEQPELHLHPRVQTRLADFFLSIVLMGKQCLIETHSEYLINRLRFRLASEEKSSRVIEKLKIYFVEKLDNQSNFREVKVNEYGAILDWPEGFFDQSQREAEGILTAAMSKKKSKKNGNNTDG